MNAAILDLGSDIKGDNLLVGHENKIEIMSYSRNVAMQVINDANDSERASGGPHVGEFTLTKLIDASTPTLNKYRCAGKSIAKATIAIDHNVTESNGQIMSLTVYTLNNAVLSDVSVNDDAGGKPVEILSLNFTKVRWELAAQKDDGTREGTVVSTWDLAANQLAK